MRRLFLALFLALLPSVGQAQWFIAPLNTSSMYYDYYQDQIRVDLGVVYTISTGWDDPVDMIGTLYMEQEDEELSYVAVDTDSELNATLTWPASVYDMLFANDDLQGELSPGYSSTGWYKAEVKIYEAGTNDLLETLTKWYYFGTTQPSTTTVTSTAGSFYGNSTGFLAYHLIQTDEDDDEDNLSVEVQQRINGVYQPHTTIEDVALLEHREERFGFLTVTGLTEPTGYPSTPIQVRWRSVWTDNESYVHYGEWQYVEI